MMFKERNMALPSAIIAVVVGPIFYLSYKESSSVVAVNSSLCTNLVHTIYAKVGSIDMFRSLAVSPEAYDKAMKEIKDTYVSSGKDLSDDPKVYEAFVKQHFPELFQLCRDSVNAQAGRGYGCINGNETTCGKGFIASFGAITCAHASEQGNKPLQRTMLTIDNADRSFRKIEVSDDFKVSGCYQNYVKDY